MAETPTNQPRITMGMALDVGRSRAGKANQDSLGSYQDYPAAQPKLAEKGLLYIVADGMGGAAGGQEASQTAVQATLHGYYDDPDLDIQRSLTKAIQEANNRIHDLGQNDPSLRGLGTTIVAAVIHRNQLILGNAGDSRAYLFRQGQLHQLSVDHSWVQEQVRRGLITEEQAELHPQRNVLTRNLGNEAEARPDFATLALQAGDTFLLCSDGLWGVVSEAEITEILQTQHGQSAAQTLASLANDHGGPDNIGIILLHIEALGDGVGAAATRTATAAPVTDRLEPLDERTSTRQMPTARLEATPPSRPAPPESSPSAASPARRSFLLPLLALIVLVSVGGYFLAGQMGIPLPGLPGAAESTPAAAATVTAETLATFTPATAASPQTSPTVAASPAATLAGTPSGGGQSPDTAPLPEPILVAPENNANFERGKPVLLRWEWNGVYTLGTHFELQIRRNGVPSRLETLNDDEFTFTPDQPGSYTWDVVVVQGERESVLSEERTFVVR